MKNQTPAPSGQLAIAVRQRLMFRFAALASLALVSVVSAYIGGRSEQVALQDGIQRQAQQVAELLADSSSNALFTFETNALDSV